jgi:hypothetical protein
MKVFATLAALSLASRILACGGLVTRGPAPAEKSGTSPSMGDAASIDVASISAGAETPTADAFHNPDASVATAMPPMPNCAPGGPGLTDCGENHESCCTSLLVPGGTFYRTYKNSGKGVTGKADPALPSVRGGVAQRLSTSRGIGEARPLESREGACERGTQWKL